MTENKIWHQHYPEEVPATLEYPEAYLTDFLLESAREFPKRDAIQFMGKRITYQELLEDVYRFAHALTELGVRKGDRVSIMLPNTPQAVIAYYGALFAGAVVVQTNPMYMERELKHQLSDSGAETIICVDLVFDKVKKVM
ncbi:MAG: AMP-binding protein, partial [Planifilum fimeticola]